MADRVSASITLGGTISSATYAELVERIAYEGLSTGWDGEPFTAEHFTPGEPLRLYSHEVPWGRFEQLEAWCVANAVPFSRWAGGYPGEWTAERVVFTGEGEPRSYTADEDDRIYVDRFTVEQCGSIAALLAHFDGADVPVPPVVITGDP